MPLSPETIINNRYRIISILGQGGMGYVYLAEDTVLNVLVAVKENLFLSEEYFRQFEREAKILAGLRHPSLPKVGDYFSIPGQGQYLIMDFIEGEDLRERIERLGTVPTKDVIRIGIAICEALNFLHTRKESILHRDIKPGNIKITPDGNIVLVDFGLAKVMRGNQATTDGARAMTPGYSPPEQYGTARTDPRSDVYSLGATLYAALSGIIPEDGLDRATEKEILTPLRQLQPSIDRKTANVIEKSLEIDPDDRYQTAESYKDALIKSSDISRLITEELRVTPPQENPIQALSFEGSDEKQNEAIKPAVKEPRSKRRKNRRKRLLRLTTFFIMSFLVGLLAGIIYLRPTLPKEIYLLVVSPTPNLTTSAIAEIILPTNTQTPTSTSTRIPPTSTPTIEPTITSTATRTPTETKTPTPTITPIGGGYGQIAFASDRTGVMQIWLMRSDGSKQEQITNIPEGACQPSWSPDGMRLAYISPCTEKNNELYPGAKIYIIELDNPSPVLLPISSEEGDFDPAWSPDGNRIAFSSLRVNTAHVFIYNFDDQSLQEISDTRFADVQPAWNPEGTQLAVVRKNVFNHIFILSDKGFTQYQLSSSGNVEDFWPTWSSDGKAVIYSRSTLFPSLPYLLSIQEEDHGTASEIRIPPAGDPNIPPIAGAAYSPDGNWIIFESWPDGRNHDVFIMDHLGENIARITTDPAFDFDPAWRPLNH